MDEAARIQAYVRETARATRDSVHVPPFTAFLHPRWSDPPFSFAVPDEPVEGDLGPALDLLRATFRDRDRVPRFELVEGFAPALPRELERAGFRLDLRSPVMTCTPDALVEPAAVPGLELRLLTRDDSIDLWQDALTVPRRAFGTGMEEPASEEDAIFARGQGERVTVAALLGGEVVGHAVAMAPRLGLAEVAGIAVAPEFRALGIGARVTWKATAEAFAAGAAEAFLTPGDDGAKRIYERAGYRGGETMLFYVDGAA